MERNYVTVTLCISKSVERITGAKSRASENASRSQLRQLVLQRSPRVKVAQQPVGWGSGGGGAMGWLGLEA